MEKCDECGKSRCPTCNEPLEFTLLDGKWICWMCNNEEESPMDEIDEMYLKQFRELHMDRLESMLRTNRRSIGIIEQVLKEREQSQKTKPVSLDSGR